MNWLIFSAVPAGRSTNCTPHARGRVVREGRTLPQPPDDAVDAQRFDLGVEAERESDLRPHREELVRRDEQAALRDVLGEAGVEVVIALDVDLDLERDASVAPLGGEVRGERLVLLSHGSGIHTPLNGVE
jgi:hypothetical protein